MGCRRNNRAATTKQSCPVHTTNATDVNSKYSNHEFSFGFHSIRFKYYRRRDQVRVLFMHNFHFILFTFFTFILAAASIDRIVSRCGLFSRKCCSAYFIEIIWTKVNKQQPRKSTPKFIKLQRKKKRRVKIKLMNISQNEATKTLSFIKKTKIERHQSGSKKKRK